MHEKPEMINLILCKLKNILHRYHSESCKIYYLNKKHNYTVIEYFPRYAEQLSNGDEVLIQKNFELSPERVVNVSDISMIGKNNF